MRLSVLAVIFLAAVTIAANAPVKSIVDETERVGVTERGHLEGWLELEPGKWAFYGQSNGDDDNAGSCTNQQTCKDACEADHLCGAGNTAPLSEIAPPYILKNGCKRCIVPCTFGAVCFYECCPENTPTPHPEQPQGGPIEPEPDLCDQGNGPERCDCPEGWLCAPTCECYTDPL